MSNLEKLLEKGAQVVGGELILRHKTMGRFRNGDFILTEDGLEELEVIDVVEVKEPKKPRAKKAEEPAAPTDDVTIDVE